MDETTYAFIKFGKKEHLESFRNNGSLYMNTLGYFKKLESMSGDKNEGMENFYQGSKTHLKLIPHGAGVGGFIKGLISFGVQKGSDLARNVFCLHAITNTEPKLHPNNLKRNGHALIINKPRIFLEMLEEAANKQKVAFQYNLVTYVDKKTHHGKMGCFTKFKEYESENEFRILKKQGTGKPFVFEIGSLEGISDIVETDKVESVIQNLMENK